MKINVWYAIVLCLLLVILSSGCGAPSAPAATGTPVLPSPEQPAGTETPEASTTPNPCVLPQLEEEVQRVHRHMREFDDASYLASNMPREQLSDPIADLQRIRREAEDEVVPDCLDVLKKNQIDHMNSVIETLVAFMGGQVDKATLDERVTVARRQHEDYVLELTRLLGITVVPATVPVISTPAETATP